MSGRDFRNIFFKQKTPAGRAYEQRARKELGLLKRDLKRLNQRFGFRHITLADGVKIYISYQHRPPMPPVRVVRIEVPEEGITILEYYLESGILDLISFGLNNCDTYKSAQRYYPRLLANSRTSDSLLGRARRVALDEFEGENQDEGRSLAVGCTNEDSVLPGLNIEYLDVAANDRLQVAQNEFLGIRGCPDSVYCEEVIQERKFAQAKIKPSLWSGKLALLVQALFGSRIKKYDATQNSGQWVPPFYVYDNIRLEFGKDCPGLVSGTDGYYFVWINYDGTFSYRKLIIGEAARPWYEATVARFGLPSTNNPLTRTEKSAYEAYLFAYADGLGALQQGVFSWPDGVLGEPLSYGWHFTWNGNKATVVVANRPLGGDNYNIYFNHVTVTITADNDSVSVAVLETDGPYHTRSRNFTKLWTPNHAIYFYSHLAIYSCTGTHTDNSLEWTDAPIYAWIDENDNICKLTWSYEFVSNGATVGDIDIETGCGFSDPRQNPDAVIEGVGGNFIPGLAGNGNGSRLQTSIDSLADSMAVFVDGTEVMRLTGVTGGGNLFSTGAGWSSTFREDDVRFKVWTAGSPSGPQGFGSAVSGAYRCGVGSSTDPETWLTGQGYDYPSTDWFYTKQDSDETDGCNADEAEEFYEDPRPVLDGALAYGYWRGPGHGEFLGSSNSQVGNLINALIPYWDCSSVFLVGETQVRLSGGSYGQDDANGNTAWVYIDGGEAYECAAALDFYSGAGDWYPWQGAYDGNFGPGSTWFTTNNQDFFFTDLLEVYVQRVLFCGREGIGRVIVDRQVGNELWNQYLSDLAENLVGGDNLIYGFTSNFGSDLIPLNDDWQNDDFWQDWKKYLDLYEPCGAGVGGLFAEGPTVRHSANYNVTVAVEGGGLFLADSTGASGVFPSLNDNLPFHYSMIGHL